MKNRVSGISLLVPEIASNGGIQSYMKRLIEVFSPISLDANFTLSLNDNAIQLEKAGLENSVIGFSKSKLKFILSSLKRVRNKEAVISGHIGLSPVGWLLKKIGFAKKHIIVLHGIEAWKKTSWIERRSLQDSDVVVATTKYTAELCSRLNNFDRGKVKVIPLCCEDIPPKFDKDFNLIGDFKILCVGRISETEKLKGFDTLLDAMEIVVNSGYSNLCLNFIGDGDYRMKLQEVVNEKGISEYVKFLGRVKDETLQSAYMQCDIFAMPSKKEGFGIVFLEAMRYGKPCIGGNYGGTPEVIDHEETGYLVKWNDAEMIADYFLKLQTNREEYKRMKEASLEKYKTNYSFSLFSSRFRKLLQAEII